MNFIPSGLITSIPSVVTLHSPSSKTQMPLTRCARGISKNGQRALFSTAASKIQYGTVQGVLFVIYVPRTYKTSYPKCPNRGKCFQPFHPAIFLLQKTGDFRVPERQDGFHNTRHDGRWRQLGAARV